MFAVAESGSTIPKMDARVRGRIERLLERLYELDDAAEMAEACMTQSQRASVLALDPDRLDDSFVPTRLGEWFKGIADEIAESQATFPEIPIAWKQRR